MNVDYLYKLDHQHDVMVSPVSLVGYWLIILWETPVTGLTGNSIPLNKYARFQDTGKVKTDFSNVKDICQAVRD